ncbi:acyloxyacyl hydrolase [Aliifodinibius sp. S!AR15-10]|uniref:acyloxyacyl hydrolase n=1 Tax=Aliifodinibius sp. S!AR15-10 TaxID=2950437 RepID=UPI002860A720|nr:acyloxyacyl hydrolase [Aliifodinibius sp. S!AR15-10]MDR8390963.1 acyloxyacyl hydrolase [Aliifodinibius sp. S!AR15-10]
MKTRILKNCTLTILEATLFAILFAGVASAVKAQSVTKNDSSSISVTEFYNEHKISTAKSGIHEYSFWGGYSFHSSNGVWGKTSGAKLSVLGLRYNRKLLKFPHNYLLKYVVEMNMHVQYQLSGERQTSPPTSISGFGLTPVGLQLNARQNQIVQPFFKSSTGFMYLSDPFPNELGTNFNFTLEAGVGLEVMITPNSFFTIGYKYHHMSNGQFGQINPGVDSNVFYGGITFY